MTRTTYMSWVAVPNHPLPEAETERLSLYDQVYLSTNDPLLSNGLVNYPPHVTLTQRLRALNRTCSVRWWAGGIAAQRPIDPLYHVPPDWLLHRQDGSILESPEPGRMLNLLSRPVQYDLADYIAAFLRERGWDGIAFDSYAPNEWMGHVVEMTNGQGAQESWATSHANWAEALQTFTQTLRWRLAQEGMEVIVNGIAPGELDPYLGMARVNAADVASGMWYEMGHKAKANPVYQDAMISAVRSVTARGCDVHWFVMPRVATLTNDPPPDERDGGIKDHRLHLANYLLCMEPHRTFYGLHPYIPYKAWDQDVEPIQMMVFWDQAWTAIRELGPALTPATRVSDGVWTRTFARGIAVANVTNGFGIVPWRGVGRIWDRWSGRPVDTTASGELWVNEFEGWVIWTG